MRGMKTQVISYERRDTLDNTRIAEIPSFCRTSENRGGRAEMRPSVEENSINHCRGRGNPEDAWHARIATVRTCVCYQEKYTGPYTYEASPYLP